MGNDDFVRDDLEDRVRKMALELPPSDLASTRAIQHVTKFVRSLLSAAPPSAPSGEPVAWAVCIDPPSVDCDYVFHSEADAEIFAREKGETKFVIQPLYAAPSGDNVSTPQSTGLSAIAQERDVGKAYIEAAEVMRELYEAFESVPQPSDSQIMAIAKAELVLDKIDFENHALKPFVKATMDMETDAKLFAAALYTITDMWRDEMDDMQRASLANQIVREIERRGIIQPAAASEAPISAEAVKSNDVAEMVERLTKTLDWYGKHYFNTIPEARTLTYDRCMALSRMCTESASLLQSLARERERLLYDLGSIANQCKVADDPEHMTLALVRKIAEHAIALSALPHPDTKGT